MGERLHARSMRIRSVASAVPLAAVVAASLTLKDPRRHTVRETHEEGREQRIRCHIRGLEL